MKIRRTIVCLLMAAHGFWSCGGSPTTPSATAELPLAPETASMRYFHEPGDTMNVPQREAFNAWAPERLAVVVPQKVEYQKYSPRDTMAMYTGQGNTNGFADPERVVFH